MQLNPHVPLLSSLPLSPLVSSPYWHTATEAKALLIVVRHPRAEQYLEPKELRYAHRDSKRLARVLQHKFGYESSNIVLMSDEFEPTNPMYPSSANILHQIIMLGQELAFGGRAFLWYSGHGAEIEDNRVFDDCGRYGIVDADGKILSGCELTKTLLDSIGEHRQLMVLFDCCYSPFILSFPHFQCNRFGISGVQATKTYGMMSRSQMVNPIRSHIARRDTYHTIRASEAQEALRRTVTPTPVRKSLPERRPILKVSIPSAAILEDRDLAMSPDIMYCDGICQCQPSLDHSLCMVKISSAIDIAFESPNKETTTSILLDVLRKWKRRLSPKRWKTLISGESRKRRERPTFRTVMTRVNKRVNSIYGQLRRANEALEFDSKLDLDPHCPLSKQAIMVSSITPLGNWMDNTFCF